MKSSATWVRILIYSGGLGLIGKLAQFAALTTLAVILLPADFGRFAVAQIVITGIASIVSSSFSLAANRAAAARAATDITSFGLVIAQSVFSNRRALGATLVLLVALAPIVYSILSGDGFQPWTIVWASVAFSMVVADLAVGSLAGAGILRTSSIVDASRLLSGGVGALTLGISGGYVGAAFGLLLGDFCVTLIVLVNLYRYRRHVDREPRLGAEGTIRAGLLANGVTQLSMWVLTAAIQIVHGLDGVGAYSVANRFASLILVAPGLISKNSLGLIAREASGPVGTAKIRVAKHYLAISVVLVAVAVVVVLLAVHTVFAELLSAYQGLQIVVLVLVIATAIRAIATSFGVVCVAWGELRIWQISDVVAACVVVVWLIICTITQTMLPIMLLGIVIGAACALTLRVGMIRRMTRQSRGSQQ
ncbi:hypothetical protein [Microbacterium esteraromaticum]|uniref:hypothetical protein n=1 Tax=Microbacterium esteraromaticum TaxID=57043 RepID=UPI0019D3A314|nr:hypothetical protein [Microbacterium esteraromaticum]MBN7793384.1 hypothetical protein [Microbacterium esteraromaticum]